MAVPVILFLIAGRKAQLVPRGVQNVMETSIDFVEKQVIAVQPSAPTACATCRC